MARKYAVLRQFALDFDRLLTEAEVAFTRLRDTHTRGAPATQPEILAIYRPIHSLKGICGMLEEAKVLVKAFHRFEDVLPPLLPTAMTKAAKHDAKTWITLGDATFRMAREVGLIIQAKVELWRQLGADENETRGLVVEFTQENSTVRTWIAITSLQGLCLSIDVAATGVDPTLVAGTPHPSGDALIVELTDSVVVVHFDQIVSTCTRADAGQVGSSQSFKDWWAARRKSRGQAVA